MKYGYGMVPVIVYTLSNFWIFHTHIQLIKIRFYELNSNS